MADDHRDPNDAILATARHWLSVEPDPDIAVELADLIEHATADPASADPMSRLSMSRLSMSRLSMSRPANSPIGSPGDCSSARPASAPPSAPVRCG